jgi:hypothetical protein
MPVKKFVFLTYGFKAPTPEIMAAWSQWFDTIKGSIVDMGGLGNGREISREGSKDLPLALESSQVSWWLMRQTSTPPKGWRKAIPTSPASAFTR